MESNVILVSQPDTYIGGDLRILLAGVSDSYILELITLLTSLDDKEIVVHTVTNDNNKWSIEVAQSCDFIIVDPANINTLLGGFLLSKKNTYWYGNDDYFAFSKRKIIDPLTFISKIITELF